MSESEIYSRPFSIDRFKLLPYSPKLEVIIAADGTIFWARPSHQEVMIAHAMKIIGCNREELLNMCPPEYYWNFMEWLSEKTNGEISVWEDFYTGGTPTQKQRIVLKKLKLAGLYKGRIPQEGDCRKEACLKKS